MTGRPLEARIISVHRAYVEISGTRYVYLSEKARRNLVAAKKLKAR